MHPMSKKEKKPEDVTPEEQTEQAVPTEETEAEAPKPPAGGAGGPQEEPLRPGGQISPPGR